MGTTQPTTPGSPAPERQPSDPPGDIRRIFLGPNGLRAGWSVLLFALFWFILSNVAGFLLYPLLPGSADAPVAPASSALLETMQFLPVLGATFLLSRIERKPLLAYGYQGRARVLRFVSGLAWGFIALSAFVLALSKLGFLEFDGISLHGAAALRDAAEWAGIFLLGALFEESFLRGYPQFAMTRGIGFWWSALVFSCVFGFVHRYNPGESPIGLVAAGSIGLVFCLSLWYTGSLWWAVGFHCAWDWAESYFYGTADSGLIVKGHLFREHAAGPLLWSGGATGPEGSVLILPFIALVALFMFLWWGCRTRSPFAGAAFRPIRPTSSLPDG